MWKKLYSNSGLILLAILGAGVWFSNLLAIYPTQPKPFSDYDNVPPVSPTPTHLKSAEEILGITPTPDLVAIYEREQRSLNSDEFRSRQRDSATAICADGTYSHIRDRSLACSRHGGVAQWLRQSAWGSVVQKIRGAFKSRH